MKQFIKQKQIFITIGKYNIFVRLIDKICRKLYILNMFKWTQSELIVLPIAFICMLAITIATSIWLKNKSDKIKNIPLSIIAILLFVLEIAKQIINIVQGYTWWTLPLHFCSFFFVWYPLAQFTKGKWQEIFKTIAFVWGFFLTIAFYVSPQPIIGNATDSIFASFSTAHTFFFHHLAILYFMLTLGLKLYKPKYEHIIYGLCCLLIYAIIAIPCAYIFDTNFCNILFSDLTLLENLRLATNQFVYDFVLLLLGALGVVIVISISTFIYNFVINKNKKTLGN